MHSEAPTHPETFGFQLQGLSISQALQLHAGGKMFQYCARFWLQGIASYFREAWKQVLAIQRAAHEQRGSCWEVMRELDEIFRHCESDGFQWICQKYIERHSHGFQLLQVQSRAPLKLVQCM